MVKNRDGLRSILQSKASSDTSTKPHHIKKQITYNISLFTTITAGRLHAVSNSPIHHLIYDTRKIVHPQTSLFIALAGNRRDGHDYIGTAYEKGIRNFLVSQKVNRKKYPDANWLQVNDTLQALQQIGQYHRQQFDLPVIGITGSNGKTIVKEWLFQLLGHRYDVVRSPHSFNSQMGVPLSVWQMAKHHQIGIFEAGISQTGEMQKLERIIRPTIGIFTNIGDAHDSGFPNKKSKIKAKLKLFKKTETLIYSSDDVLLDKTIRKHFHQKRLTWSNRHKADLTIEKINPQTTGITKITGVFNDKKYHLQIPFTDPASIENAIHCWLTALHLGMPIRQLQQAFKRLTPVAMRLELISGIRHSLIVNDGYNADVQALAAALHFLQQQGDRRKRIVLLSDFLETGKKDKKLYQSIANLVVEKKVDQLIGIGTHIAILKKLLPDSMSFDWYPDTEGFLSHFDPDIFQSAIILLKGARPFRFEKIATRLTEKHHQTTLEVNLNALLHNLDHYARKLRPDTKIMAMVKASAYGIGSIETARLLAEQSIHYLAVAFTDEGIALRKAGIELPILVLNPEEAAFEALVQHRLEPEIYSIGQLKRLLALTEIAQMPTGSFPIHVNFNTGMNRLGLEDNEVSILLKILAENSALQLASVFSHLAASETARHDRFTKRQASRFIQITQKIAASLGYLPLRHLLNSSGIARFPQYQFDMVRLGIGLYGYDGSRLDGLETVHTLKATISQIKTIKKGETVGYGRKGRIRRDTRIATVNIGYADGLLRKAGNGRFQALLHGRRIPTVGNICMDMCMMDVTAVTQAKVGDEVVIFGENLPVTELADCLGTIPYEIFTGISARVKRVYVQE